MSETTENATLPPETPKKVGASSSTKKRIALIIIVVAVITALVVFAVRTNALDKMTDYFAAQKVVATVNGARITQGELSKTLEKVAPGQTETIDETVRTQILEDLISVRLLVDTAKERGHEATEEDVQKRIEELQTQLGGKEAFEKQLIQSKMTEKELREEIADEISMQKLLDAETEMKTVEATDEEVQKSYDEAIRAATEGGATGEIPPIADVRDIIVEQIKQKKQYDIITTYITTLRENAKIDVTI